MYKILLPYIMASSNQIKVRTLTTPNGRKGPILWNTKTFNSEPLLYSIESTGWNRVLLQITGRGTPSGNPQRERHVTASVKGVTDILCENYIFIYISYIPTLYTSLSFDECSLQHSPLLNIRVLDLLLGRATNIKRPTSPPSVSTFWLCKKNLTHKHTCHILAYRLGTVCRPYKYFFHAESESVRRSPESGS